MGNNTKINEGVTSVTSLLGVLLSRDLDPHCTQIPTYFLHGCPLLGCLPFTPVSPGTPFLPSDPHFQRTPGLESSCSFLLFHLYPAALSFSFLPWSLYQIIRRQLTTFGFPVDTHHSNSSLFRLVSQQSCS